MPRRRLLVLLPVAAATLVLSACGGGSGTVGSGPLGGVVTSCPTISYPDPDDASKTVDLPSSDTAPIADDLGLGDLLKGACYYDIASTAPADAEADSGVPAEGGLFVIAKPDDPEAYLDRAAALLKEKKFEVTTDDTSVSGTQAIADDDSSPGVSVAVTYSKDLTAEVLASDSADFYGQLGVKEGDSVITGYLTR